MSSGFSILASLIIKQRWHTELEVHSELEFCGQIMYFCAHLHVWGFNGST